MTFLIQQTLIYAIPLMIVALAGVFAERSGIINLALEGIMIFGAFIGVLFVNLVQQAGTFDAAKAAGDWVALQGFEILAMLAAAVMGAVFSLAAPPSTCWPPPWSSSSSASSPTRTPSRWPPATPPAGS